jgi:hypothetical protein
MPAPNERGIVALSRSLPRLPPLASLVDLGNPVADFFPLRGAGVGVLPRIAKRDGITGKSPERRQGRAMSVDGNPLISMSISWLLIGSIPRWIRIALTSFSPACWQ